MVNARGIARVGMLAVGLGVGAAIASTPGTASADSSTDWLSSIDSLLGGVLPASSTPSGLDYQISINGTDLFPTADNSATATSGTGDIAIAYGADSSATAEGGTGDYALADGTYALANAGSLTGTSDNYDSAIDIGNNVNPTTYPGAPDGAYAGGASLIGGADTGTSSNDTAIDIGNNGVSTDTSFPGDGGNTGAFAGDGGLIGASGAGNGDTAINFGNDNGFGLGPAAVDGSGDYASQDGDYTGTNLGSLAGFGNDDIASVVGPQSSAYAGGSGPSDLGNNDIAYVLDPTGPDGSNAFAGFDPLTGAVGSSELAGVNFEDNVTAIATASTPVDILPAMAADSGSSSVDSLGNLLADLASLF
jgi:hypothetical protein